MPLEKKDHLSDSDKVVELQDELARVREELDRFVSVASHDLQAPLNKIQGFADLLRRIEGDRLSQKGSHYIDVMVEATADMQELIQALLLYSRIGSRAQPFEQVDLSNTVELARFKLDKQVQTSKAKIDVAALPTIEADPNQIVQLFEHLLRNALTYVDQGVVPEILIACTNQDQGLVQVTIEDNGIGVDSQYAEKIFDIFERLHTKAEYPGVGVGLALCRKIVERHGGTIRMESSASGGARVLITLPEAH